MLHGDVTLLGFPTLAARDGYLQKQGGTALGERFVLVEKGKQQALDVQAIHIGVSGDDHAIELEATDIEEIARPGTKHIDDCPDLFVLNEAVQIQSDMARARGEVLISRAKSTSEYLGQLVANGAKTAQENFSKVYNKTA